MISTFTPKQCYEASLNELTLAIEQQAMEDSVKIPVESKLLDVEAVAFDTGGTQMLELCVQESYRCDGTGLVFPLDKHREILDALSALGAAVVEEDSGVNYHDKFKKTSPNWTVQLRVIHVHESKQAYLSDKRSKNCSEQAVRIAGNEEVREAERKVREAYAEHQKKWLDWAKEKAAVYGNKLHAETAFAKYLALANNDREVAMRFFVNAYGTELASVLD